jgi:predicted nucleotidyltransferase
MTDLSTIPLSIPSITRRTRIPQEAIDNVVRQIEEKFQPLKIILFGSYAYGTPRSDSDVDLLVIMETPLKEVEQEIRICQMVEYHFGLDLLVKTPATLADRLKLGDPFLKEIIQKGKVLYERTAP